MELKVEREIAILADRFVLRADDCVHLSSGAKEASNMPLLRMQQELKADLELRDCLSSQLASQRTLITQGETLIQHLEYRLDKLKVEQEAGEQAASDQIKELETKNESLRTRLHELARQNQDLKGNTAHMERKVDQLTEENGTLSFQVREIHLQLATSEAEVERLTEHQATVEKELHCKTSHLQAELSQATAQKELQNEQILILQGKISALEEDLRRVSEEEKGENMGPVMEREVLRGVYEDQIGRLKEEIQQKQEMMDLLKNDSAVHVELLHQEIQTLRNQVDTLTFSLKEAEEDVQTKEDLLTKRQLDRLTIQKTLEEKLFKEFQEEVHGLKVEVHGLQGPLACMTTSIRAVGEEIKAKEQQEKTEQGDILQKCMAASVKEMKKLKEIQEEEVEQMTRESQGLTSQVTSLSSSLKQAEEEGQAKELVLQRQVVASQEDVKRLNQVIQGLNTFISHSKEAGAASLHQKAALQKLQAATLMEKETLVQEKESLQNRLLQTEQRQKTLEVTKAEEWNERCKGLQEQLTAKSEAAEHLKFQMEKAMSLYKGKKRLLQASQEQVAEMDMVKSNEKNLLRRVASLETQLALADIQLREHNKMRGEGGRTDEKRKIQTCEPKEELHDSLEEDTLEDSLNTTGRPSAPGVSSNPLVRSLELLTRKPCGLGTDSLESLCSNPMAKEQTYSVSTKRRVDDSLPSINGLEVDSAMKDAPSAVKRCRTTQVINVTMIKKTVRRPGGPDHRYHSEDDNTFCSLTSARSQPNRSNSQAIRPISVELFGTPADKVASGSHQLLSLPDHRYSTTPSTTHSTTHSTTPSMAQSQGEYRAGPPASCCSYSLESRPSLAPELIVTDEDMRTGDPSDTMRRACMRPGQLQDSSSSSHPLSYMAGQTGTTCTAAHRHSLMPGQLPTRGGGCTQRSSSPRQSKCEGESQLLSPPSHSKKQQEQQHVQLKHTHPYGPRPG
ncbi:hypothetical protein NHX12_020643 [Muraenolepis orangiensis]|uniref:Uncharacterized protein n=1 Tax=Muraenolepis orangiensis TaxID=630683 RepID=A0A9Q0ERT5_9TELE|nr:hypothetical protein NHX12_020643 [Muraenolepis orangiensis]